MYKNIIVIEKEGEKETWSSLPKMCKAHPEFSYSYLSRLKFPCTYKGWEFNRVPLN